jgi:hypothetical protein
LLSITPPNIWAINTTRALRSGKTAKKIKPIFFVKDNGIGIAPER